MTGSKEKKNILENKLYLYLTEFFSGVSVMAVELGASRLLAPYFSSSQIVWTIIIGTIMIAMALGNLYGGRSADKNPDPSVLYKRIIIAALWIAAIPFLGKYVILGISALLIMTISTNLLIIAAFISCMIIFVFPLFLLGTVGPSLVKYTVDSLDDSGSIVGRLNACNTIGSIIGTFLPTFVTIPAVGTSLTFIIFSGILALIGMIYFISEKKAVKFCIISVILFIVFSFFGHNSSFAFWEDDLTYEGESVYNYLQVKDSDDMTILSTNVLFGVQSVKMKEDGLTGLYYDYDLAAPYMASYMANEDSAPEVLILGNCAGTFASQCIKYFPDAYVEGVEIDGKITKLAREYFAMPDSVVVTEYDGRAYLQTIDRKYDVIQVDAYQDITIPFQMSSVEFFTLVRDHLKENGVMVVNMNMHSDGEGSINEYLCDTISSVFPNVYTVDVSGSTNKELFAAVNYDIADVLQQTASQMDDADVKNLMLNIAGKMVPYESKGHILTDDKAPVELLGMSMIDELIQDELAYYKSYYGNMSLREIIDSL